MELSKEQIEQVMVGFNTILQAVGAKKLSDILRDTAEQFSNLPENEYQKAYTQLKMNTANLLASALASNQDSYVTQIKDLFANLDKHR